MSKIGNATKKVLAAVLTMLLVFGMVPVSAIPTSAATTDYPEAVTITVKDDDGNAVEGAQVTFKITDTADVEIKSETVTTNANGSAVILNKSDYVDGLKVTGNVTKENYEESVIDGVITSEEANISVTLNTNKITDVVVTGVSREVIVSETLELVATDAVNISGLKFGDEVSYKINGNDCTDMPKISGVGTYNVTVNVKRAGYENYETSVVSEITTKVLNIDAAVSSGLVYNGKEQTLVKINNAEELKNNYGVTLTVENEKATDAGTYLVKVTGTSPINGVVVAEKNFSVKIDQIKINSDLAKINTYAGKYDGQEHLAATVELKEGIKATITYSLDGGEWTTECPTVKEVGKKLLKIRIVPEDKKNYLGEGYARWVEVSKGVDRGFQFHNGLFVDGGTTNYTAPVVAKIGETISIDETFSFYTDVQEKTPDDVIEYKVEKVGADGNATFDGYNLKVSEPGTYRVSATIKENKNFEEKTITHTIVVKSEPKDKDNNYVPFISFGETDEINYYVNKNDMVLSEAVAKSTVKDTDAANITYAIYLDGTQKAPQGISHDINGKVYISDFDKFIRALNIAEGEIRLKVVATKGEGKLCLKDSATYYINVRYPITPSFGDENPLLIYDYKNISSSGWINSNVKVSINEAAFADYEVALAQNYGQTTQILHPAIAAPGEETEIKAALNEAFGDSVEFKDDGDKVRRVYVCDKDGNIFAPIDVKIKHNGVEQNLKIDTHSPDASKFELGYSDSITELTIDTIRSLFYRDQVIVNFKAYDKLSGIEKIEIIYDGTTYEVKDFESFDDGKGAQGSFMIKVNEDDKDYAGKITLRATDRAGLYSEKTGDKNIVVDPVSPALTVKYVNPVVSENQKHYFNENEGKDLCFQAILTETNGFESNGTVKVFKDGKVFNNADIKYERVGKQDIYTVTVGAVENKDGVYTVEVVYVDKSENQMVGSGAEKGVFVSEEMVIDTTAPEVTFAYEEKTHNNEAEICDDYTVTLTVKEVNFDAARLSAVITAKDINKNDVLVDKLNAYITDENNWYCVDEEGNKLPEGQTSDIHKCTILSEDNLTDVLPDAIYENIEFTCQDPSKNKDVVNSDSFIIDTTAPSAPKIGYDKSISQVILDAVTFGKAKDIIYKYFDAPTRVTLTSTDATSGVANFVLKYNREKGASETNAEFLEIKDITAKQNKYSEHIFEATVTLPESMSLADFEQLRGSLTAYAVDNHGIKSETVTDDETVIVVDSINPELSVTYDKAQRTEGEGDTATAYYNKDIKVKLEVEEVNFDAEDFKVTITRDGTDIGFDPSTIEWKPVLDKDGKKTDKYAATITIKADYESHTTDGDYFVNIYYKDKATDINKENSRKKAVEYTSHRLVLDTILPEITVLYEDTAPLNTLEDINGITRDYFAGKQTARIIIKERNFNKDEVDFTILEQDVTGEPLSETTYAMSEWSDEGEYTHVIIITYAGEDIDGANYTFDIAYTDLATNVAADYAEDYFTVDNTAPKLSVKQINRVATTIINNITFGYFGGTKDKNAKAEVEVTVEDDISFANIVTATYKQTEGTSTVNKKAETQTADADKIKLSDDGKTATTTFKLPVTVLKTDKKNMNGAVDFVAHDRAGNSSADNEETKSVTGVIVDNISPKAKIEYSKPYTTENKISYYDGKITGTITVTEANFDNPEDFHLYYSKDGGKKTPIKLKWTDESVDVHVATFTLAQDGDYILTADYKDKATNKMADYKSNQLTIDTKINAPVITFQGNSNGGLGFNDEVIPGVKFEDDNYKSYQITLTRTRYDEKNIDVKDKFIGNRVAINANGGSGSFNTFEKIRDNDGVYTLTVRMTDMVDHSSTTSRTFVVNRFGSVYVYNDALIDLIKDRYVQDVNDELVITEYNANKLKEDTLKVDISRDGRPVDDVIASTAPVKNNGWYEYAHTINRENFNAEGLYKIALSSTDEINNDSQNKEAKNTLKNDFSEVKDVLWFKVDKTLPSITNISFKDEAKNKDSKYTEINAEGTEVEFTVYDAIGIAKVEVIVDGESTTYEGETLGDDINNFVGKITLAESKKQQEVIIKVTDLAGRVLDTSKKDEAKDSIPDSFTGSVLVSTNFFVRFWNDKPVFWGVVGGTLGAAALVIILVALKKRKKKDDK